MAQVINTNVTALFAAAALNRSAQALQTAQQRLSSGLRINSVKDDATGLVTATTYDASIRGTNVAIRNANDAISSGQTNDGYAAQIVENLQRLHEIFVQTADAGNVESAALITENGRIAALTSAAPTGVTVDGNGGTVSGTGTAVTAPTGSTAAAVLTDIDTVTANRAAYGADIATFSSAVATMQSAQVNLAAAYSRVMDTDYATESMNATRTTFCSKPVPPLWRKPTRTRPWC